MILKLQFQLCSFVIYIIFFCQSFVINNYLSRMTLFFHLNQHFFRLGLNIFFSFICKLKVFSFYCIIHLILIIVVVLKMKNYPVCKQWYTVTNLSHNWWIPLASIAWQQNWPIHFEELKLQHLTLKQLFTCVWQQFPPMSLKHLSVSSSKVQFRTTYTLGIPFNMTFSFDTLGVVFPIVANRIHRVIDCFNIFLTLHFYM